MLKKYFNLTDKQLNNYLRDYTCSFTCYSSHCYLWDYLLSQSFDISIIMEDDITLTDKFDLKLNFIIKYLPSDWDVYFIGLNKIYGTPVNKYIKRLYSFVSPIGIENSGLFGYIVNKKGLRKLLSICKNMTSDSFRTEYIDHKIRKHFSSMNVYSGNQNLVLHNDLFKSLR